MRTEVYFDALFFWKWKAKLKLISQVNNNFQTQDFDINL